MVELWTFNGSFFMTLVLGIFLLSWFLLQSKPFYWQTLMIGSVIVDLQFLLKYIFNCIPSKQKYVNMFTLLVCIHYFQIKENSPTVDSFMRYQTGFRQWEIHHQQYFFDFKLAVINAFSSVDSLIFLEQMSADPLCTSLQTFGNVFKPVVFKIFI